MKKSSLMNRRQFVKTVGFGATAAAIGLFTSDIAAAVARMDPITVTRVEAIQFENAHWTWVRLHTDQGIVGTGETYPRPKSQLGALADVTQQLLGRDAREIEHIWGDMFRRVAFNVTGGAEMRIISAVNIALYDILGQALGVPVYQLLGGRTRDEIRVYQTSRGEIKNNWTNEENIEEIVQFLYDRGITAIKIWPFDDIGWKRKGAYISLVEAEQRLDLIKRIRSTLGNKMEIALEFHSYWNLPSAFRIAEALEPYDILWLEDMFLQGNMQSYAALARETSIPVAVSERLATKYQYREVLEAKGCDIAMYDLTWCGGFTSATNISTLADTHYVPTALHTHGGPILWLSSIHTATALRSLMMMESTYAHYTHQFPNYITDYPVPENGFVQPSDDPGLGLHVRPEIFQNGEAVVEELGAL